MSTVEDVHHELTDACLVGDLNLVLQLAYYHPFVAESLIAGAINKKIVYKDYLPGDYLFIACERGFHDLAIHLIKLGADPKQSPCGSPILVACRNNHVKVIEVLSENGAALHPNGVPLENTPIYAACYHGSMHAFDFIIRKEPFILMQKADNSPSGGTVGDSLLYLACVQRQYDIAKYLLSKGVNVTEPLARPGFEGLPYSPLSAACQNADTEIGLLLLDHKAEIPKFLVYKYPEFLGSLFKRQIRHYRRSYSISQHLCKALPEDSLCAYWDSMFLHALHPLWIQQYSANLHFLDIHANSISKLPENFFEMLPVMEELDVSCNKLEVLPSRGLQYARWLTRLSASKNRLTMVPCELFMNTVVVQVDLSFNEIEFLPPDGVALEETDGSDSSDDEAKDQVNSLQSTQWHVASWSCTSLKVLKVAHNKLKSLPHALQGACGLERLLIYGNLLKEFNLAWKCPLVELDISSNCLTSFNPMVDLVWSKSLQKLNLSGNQLTSISWNVCRLTSLQHLDVSKNLISALPMVEFWTCHGLCKLNLSHNLLTASCGPDGFADVQKAKLESSSSPPTLACNFEVPVETFKGCLQTLDLSYNQLEILPESVCQLENLAELDLSNNPDLHHLPPELGNLKNIWNFRLENVVLHDLPFDNKGRNYPKEVLAHLRAKLRKSVLFNRMKLMLVGLQGRGKTTLLAVLQGKRPPPNISTVGINVVDWSLQPTTSDSSGVFTFFRGQPLTGQSQDIVFSAWDLAGQNVYYATHQCFLTSNTLYLAVWNTTHGVEGVKSLGPWLLNIQARAPKSKVITVGTHIDLLPGNKQDFLLRLDSDIMERYDKKGFPSISGNVFVSCVTGEGLSKLRDVIYRVASKMVDSNIGSPMLGKKVPLSYIQLYDMITKECQTRRIAGTPPILTVNEVMSMAEKNPDNDINDVDELVQAAKFLHDSGILLHYNEQLHELNTLFFIDPSWLCDMLSMVVTVRERNPFIIGGYICHKDLLHVALKTPRLPERFIPQYLQLLEKFEIALSLDESQFLIPSMLPNERPGFLKDIFQAKDTGFLAMLTSGRWDKTQSRLQYLCRNYNMSYVPSGFWSRLIARLIIAVHKWGVIVGGETNVNCQHEGKGMLVTNDYSMMYWKEGLLVMYEGGHFLIESFSDDAQDPEAEYSSEGVAIRVASAEEDFSSMGFIADNIDMLITEWYPGLEDADESGNPLIQKLIPCPICITAYKEKARVSDSSLQENMLAVVRNETYVHQFQLQVCALAATGCDAIMCPKHSDQPVLLRLLIPDLLLTDLPPHLVIEKEFFEFIPSDETRLGEGGAGGVYRGMYKGQAVAVKQFHSATKSKHFDSAFHSNEGKKSTLEMGDTLVYNPVEGTLQEVIEDGKVIRAFWDLRQEVTVLCRLQHPNIISLIGVSHSPLSFVIELAPLGSLQPILEERRLERDGSSDQKYTLMDPVLGKMLSHQISLQVAHALSYLHRSEIVYRDLKSDNILVWSLSIDDIINVKISDYGISTFFTPQGIVGEGGTPGYQAPEVKAGCPYDEKVDVFSFGIWLYELMSGYRPFHEYRTALEMRKALQRGERPSLANSCVDCQMPNFEQLMEDCWKHNPVSRPSMDEIVCRLEKCSMPCFCCVLPKPDQPSIERVTCVFSLSEDEGDGGPAPSLEGSGRPPGLTGHRLLVWCGDGDTRRYLILDVKSAIVQNDLICPGPRVLCAARVGKFIWLGTEGSQIEVFGRSGIKLPSTLWKIFLKDHVMCLVAEKRAVGQVNEASRVYAALANGTLSVFSRAAADDFGQKSLFEEDQDDGIFSEKEAWSGSTVVNLGTKGLPAKCMALFAERCELWVGSGNCLVIVDTSSLTVIEQIKVFSSVRRLISAIASDGDRAWTTDRKSAIIYQWDVASRTRVWKFDCLCPNPVNTCVSSVCTEEVHSGESANTDGKQGASAEPRSTSSSLPTLLDFEPLVKDVEGEIESALMPCEISDSCFYEGPTDKGNADVSGSPLSSPPVAVPVKKPLQRLKYATPRKSFGSAAARGTEDEDDDSYQYLKLIDDPGRNAETSPVAPLLPFPVDSLAGVPLGRRGSPTLPRANQPDGQVPRRRKTTTDVPNFPARSDYGLRAGLRSLSSALTGVVAGLGASVAAAPSPDRAKLASATSRHPESVSNASDALTPLFSESASSQRSLKKQPSLMISKKQILPGHASPRGATTDAVRSAPGRSSESRPRTSALSFETQYRVTSILYEKGTLWAGRSSGDVLVISVKNADKTPVCSPPELGEVAVGASAYVKNERDTFGLVLALLGDAYVDAKTFREVSSVVKISSDRIVSLVRLESRGSGSLSPSRTGSVLSPFDSFQILAFSAWGCDQFESFERKVSGMRHLDRS